MDFKTPGQELAEQYRQRPDLASRVVAELTRRIEARLEAEKKQEENKPDR